MFSIGELVTLLSESFGCKKGDKLIYLWDTNDSGHFVALCVVDDKELHEVLNINNCSGICEYIEILEKMNNVDSITLRLHCIKPYKEQITNMRILKEKKQKLLDEMTKIDEQMELVTEND